MGLCLPLLLLALCTTLVAAKDDTSPRVRVAQGSLVGSVAGSVSGRQFFSFRGIRYAQPPIGELRFKAPVPVAPSDANGVTIDASNDAPTCTQKNYLLPTPTLSGQEDCLFLNVYTPRLPGKTEVAEGVAEKEPLPVMVYIHGGGWFTGTGASYFNGADRLLDEDVVLVTFNYRLGALGFLSTDDANAPGNAGLKDQVEALRWVQRNVHAFSGDPNKVTIFGQSAGSASVHYHMLSPLSKGLFHRAVSQSGFATSPWAWPTKGLPAARKQAQFVGCPHEDTAALVSCLRSVDANNLTDSGDKFHYWSIDPLTTFVPVVEPPGEGSFLLEPPLEALRHGRFSKVPWMMGTVAAEGIVRAVPIVTTPALLADVNANWTTLVPRLAEIDKSVPKPLIESFWANVTKFYLDGATPLTPNNAKGFVDLYSDRGFVHAAHKASILQASHGHDKIFMYHLDYRGSHSYSVLFAASPVDYGMSHCDDLIYLFRAPLLFTDWPEGHPDQHLSKTLVSLWTTFAKHGTPTVSGSAQRVDCDLNTTCDISQLDWPAMSISHPIHTKYLSVRGSQRSGVQLTVETDLLAQRMNFWDDAPLIENDAQPVYTAVNV